MSRRSYLAAALSVALAAAAGPAIANCDSEAGPVVAAGRQALERGDPAEALVWVRPEHEPTIRAAFQDSQIVRRRGADAKRLADRYFLETLVRLHRVGEGKPNTGLRPAAEGFAPGMVLVNEAVAAGSDEPLTAGLAKTINQGVQARLADLRRKQTYDPQDLAAGREYVESYVRLVLYVETLHRAAAAEMHGSGVERPR